MAAVAEGLRAGRVTYTDSWLQDCVFYVANNHILLACFFAHPDHPNPRLQRSLLLFASLTFAFFITAWLKAFVPWELANVLLSVTVGTFLQLLFDVPFSMLAACPCAHKSLPEAVQGICKGISIACLSCHSCCGLIYALVGVLMLMISPAATVDGVFDLFVQTKASAFITAIPFTILTYSILRRCEDGQRRAAGYSMA